MANKALGIFGLIFAVAMIAVVIGQVITLSATGSSATSGALSTLFDSIPTLSIIILGGGVMVALFVAAAKFAVGD